MYYATEAFRTICYSSITLRCPDSCKGSLGEIIYLHFSTLFKFKGKKKFKDTQNLKWVFIYELAHRTKT